MPFDPTEFLDYPSTSTPITAAELNKLGRQYEQALADGALAGVPTGTTPPDSNTPGILYLQKVEPA